MIIVLRPDASALQVQNIADAVAQLGCRTQPIEGTERSVLAVLGHPTFEPSALRDLPGVIRVLRVGRPYKLASREVKRERSQVRIKDVTFGGEQVVVIAGPCSVETRETVMAAAAACAETGVTVLRGAAFKPRTSPYAFQGKGEEALVWIAEAGQRYGLVTLSEVTSPDNVGLVADYADALQVGTAHMQNSALLEACAATGKPVVLERGASATIDEWLQAAEYILQKNPNVILCERGIRTFGLATRYTLDLNAVVVLEERTHLPVIVDPSYGTGNRRYVAPMARAAVAAGADGVTVQIHPEPAHALSNAGQSLHIRELAHLVRDLQTIAPVVGRRLDLRTSRPATVTTTGDLDAKCIFQGENGAFSQKAAWQVFGPDAKTLGLQSFRAVFEAVATGRAPYGIVPVENTLGGSIHENFDHLREFDVTIVAEHHLRVVHNLIANRGTRLADVRKIYAHPQAAAQCDGLIRQHPEWTVYQVYDTAGSALMIKDQGILDGAAIAGARVADLFDMEVLAAGIETHPENYTRFLVIAHKPDAAQKPTKSSLVYATADKPGALVETLNTFKAHQLNLCKLESRPIPGRPWEYMFYVDVMGVLTDAVLIALRQQTTELKVLGVYPGA